MACSFVSWTHCIYLGFLDVWCVWTLLYLNCFTLKMKALWSFRMSGNTQWHSIMSSPLVIHLISGRGCVHEVRWRYQNYGSMSVVSHFNTQPVQSTMDGEQTCNLQKNQQSSAVRMSKRFMQRPKAIVPASKGSLVSIFVCFYNGKVVLSSYWLELHRETKYCVKAYVNLICSYVSLMVCGVWGDTFWRFKELWSVRTMERGTRIEDAPSQ